MVVTLTLPAAALSQALRSAAQVVETKNTLLLLACVKFEGATITTSNLDIQYTSTLEAEGELTTCVDAKKLAAWAAAASGTVTLTLDGSLLTAKAGRSRMVLPALPVADFPMLPPVEGKGMAVDLAEPIKRTLWAASTAPTQAYISGVRLCAAGGKARMVATDGYKMPIVTTEAKWPKGNPDVSLPAPLAKIIGDAGTGILTWDDRKATFQSGLITITGKVLEGAFPDHLAQLAKVAGEPYALDAGEFANAIRRVRIASDAQQRKIRLTRLDGAVSIRIEGTSGFEGADEVDADCTAGFEAGFNADYLAAMLGAAGEDTVTIEQDGPNTMARICPAAQSGLKFEGLLWPLRI